MRFACAVAVAVLSLAAPVRACAQTSLDAFGAGCRPISCPRSAIPVCRFDFGGRVGIRSPARRSSDGRVRPAGQRHARSHWNRAGAHRPQPEGVGVLWRRRRTPARIAAIGGQPVCGGQRRCRPSPIRRQRAWIGHRCHRQNGVELCGHERSNCGWRGGVLLHGGPLQIDLGYRYKRILAGNTLSSILSAGDRLDSHQLRFGVGVRF